MSATYISTVWFKRAKSSTGMVTQRFNKFTASTLKIDIYRLYENPIYTSQTLRTMMVTGATKNEEKFSRQKGSVKNADNDKSADKNT